MARFSTCLDALDNAPTACHKIDNSLRGGVRVDFISILSIFVLACFVGYFVVWSVTPSKWLGLIAVALASVNIFGGFAVTQRMLSMYKKKERRDA